MTREPILAARSLPVGDGYRVPRTFRVEGGLHYLKGNKAPYFTLTYTSHRKGFPNQCYSGGAGHDEILRYFPRFAGLAALHLSDLNGEPMHAEANGWYWLAGAIGGAGERYHGGADKSGTECLEIFARHCRIGMDEAQGIATTARNLARRDADALAAGIADTDYARDYWRQTMDGMRARWQREADEARDANNLRIFGDQWPPDQDD